MAGDADAFTAAVAAVDVARSSEQDGSAAFMSGLHDAQNDDSVAAETTAPVVPIQVVRGMTAMEAGAAGVVAVGLESPEASTK